MNCRSSLPISTAASIVGAMTERLSADDIVDLARDNLRAPGPDRDAAYKKLIEENDVAFGVWIGDDRIFDVYLIKGRGKLETIAYEDPHGEGVLFPPKTLKTTAIPCASIEYAILMRLQWGDDLGPDVATSRKFLAVSARGVQMMMVPTNSGGQLREAWKQRRRMH
jgi:hypothetical protein